MIVPREEKRTDSAISASSGDRKISNSADTARSNVRLMKKSMPSNTGGRSSNSGTEAPGTNSARWTRISIVEGAIRTVTPR